MNTSQKQSATPGNADLRKFGLLFGAILSVLFGLLLPFVFGKAWPVWPWAIAVVFVSLALVFPRSLIIAYVPWIKFGEIAGWINTRIILAFLFYIILTPFGLVIRLFGGDLLKRKLDNNSESYRVESLPQSKDHMETPY